MDFLIGLLLVFIGFKFIKKIGKLVFSLIMIVAFIMLVKGILGINLIEIGLNLLGFNI